MHEARAGQRVTLPPGRLTMSAGSIVPVASGIEARDGKQWSRPVSTGGAPGPLLVYSLLLGTCLGRMGLPHILVRFYTNPEGAAARRTTVWVLAMLGIFYVTPFVYSILGRALTPGLYVTIEAYLGDDDATTEPAQ